MTQLWHSLSFRLALLYAALLGMSMTALFAAYYVIVVSLPLGALRDQIQQEATALAAHYERAGADALASELIRRAENDEGLRAFHSFHAPDGRRVTTNLPSVPTAPFQGWLSIEADVYYEGDEIDFSALSRDRLFPDGARLIVGRDAEEVEDLEESFFATAPWVIGLTLVLGAAGGFFMSRSIGRRIDAISATARQVMEGDLAGRVSVRGSGDDFDRLAQTLNLMLERNEALLESVRRVSDHVAHELRTPLARLLGRLEQLDVDQPDLETLRTARDGALDEAHRLQRIFDALLRISRMESGRFEAEFCTTDLGKLAADVHELYAPIAKVRGIALSMAMAGQVTAKVERELLFQALVNLLDNALKHTPDGGRIVVGVARGDGGAVLSVSDSGAGLQPGEAQHVAERFFRGAGAEGKPGEGLGLSVVDAIVMLHKGRLSFADGKPGLRVELWLPD
jgi:signal transduction histidine kinase